MGTPQKRIILSLETTYELIMAIEKKEMPKSKIAKDFGINPSTLTITYKQRSAVIESFESGD